MEDDDIILRAPGQNPQAPTLPITERRTRYDDVADRLGGDMPVPDIDTQAPRSRYDDVVDRLEEQRNRLLDATISSAVRQNPDRVGEAQRLEAETGVPAGIAERNIEELRQRAIEQRIRQMRLAQTNPVLARQMRDPNFAAIAYDQVENLSTTESIFRWFQEIPEDLQIGWEAGRLTTELGYLGERAMTGRATDEDMTRIGSLQQRLQELRGSEGFLEAAAKIVGQQADTLPEALTFGAAAGLTTGGAALIAGQAGPQIAVPEEIITVPSATIGGFFAGTMAKMGEQSYRIEAGHAYLDMIEAGVDRNVAINVGAGVGLVNAGLEVVGLGFVARPIKSALTRVVTERLSESLQQATMRTAVRSFAINYGLAVGAETTTEVIQEMVNIAGLELGKQLSDADMNSLLSSEDRRQEIADRLVGAFEEVAKGMAVLALPGAGFNFRYDYRRAQESRRQQEFFQNLNEAAASSEVRNRNPAAYERFIEAQAEGTPVENIYIDGKELDNILNQSGVTRQQLEARLPEIAAQLDEAVNTGSDVIIPTSQYAARVAGSDLGNAMMEHVRVTPEGMSVAEARQFQREQQSLMDEAKRIMDEQATKDDTFTQGAQEVRQQVLDQIKGARTYTDKVARTYADMVRDFVVTQSSALNMNPRDFYQQYMYQVQAAERARMGEAQLFDQAGQVMPESPAFRGFYGQSVFRDNEGNAQVLYHGTPDDVSAFDLDHPNRKDSGWLGTGVYLTDNPDLAGMYADQKARSLGPRGQNVMPLYARLENPYYATPEEKAQIRAGGRQAADAFTARLREEGHDGVIMQLAPDAQEIVVFDPAAVKSVFNDGTWSTEDANLLAQRSTQRTAGGQRPDGDGLLRQGARTEGEPATVVFEVAPDPNNFALANRWRSLGNAERLDASNRVAQEIVPAVLQAAGAQGSIVNQVGSYLDDTNPSFAIKLTQGNPVEVAKALGFVLSQDSMMVVAPRPFEGSFETGAIRINIGQQTNEQVDAFYQSLRNIDGFPQIQGQSTTEGFMTIMLDPSVDAQTMAEAIDQTLGGDYTVDFASIHGAFPEKQEYNYASEQTDPAGSAGLARQRYRDARTEAAASLNRAVLAVERGRTERARAGRADTGGVLRQLGAPGVQRLRASDLAVGKRYGAPVDGATSVRGVHYSRSARPALAGTFYGAGLRGAESRRLEQTDDVRIKQRIHFYVDTGNGVRPESGVGGNVHAVDLDNVYDISADPLGFMQQRTMPFDDMGTWFNEIETMVVDAGFDGIYVPRDQGEQGVVVLLGPNVVEVDVLGTQADVLAEQESRYATEQETLAQGAGLEQTGDGAGRYSGGGLAPLEGTPSVPGFSGPDPRLVAVAEQYARDNGIDLKRQSEYVEVDPARAKRIADAYEAMQHTPNDPVVREAYENLIAQTRAQYDALVAAGYRFWFTDLNIPENVDYLSTPWNAMRDIRANQTMGVFPTDDGFGSGEFDPAANPLLADTGLQWPVGGPDGTTMKTVYASDLFRAVHDAFGHGLEGSGFRARGEENAWQAHVRLFTGSAVGAITSETRGQNSWLNFGPNGEANQTATVEDTVFADQKTGLMPEWTWTEGRAGDMVDTEALRQASQVDAQRRAVLDQQSRGGFDPRKLTTILNEKADYSTFLHETAHFFLTVYADMAQMPNATQQMRDDMQTVLDWFGVKDLATWNAMSLDEQRQYHESFAYNFEIYLFEGKAPSVKMQSMFDKFASWLRTVYVSIRDELNAIYRDENGVDLPILTGEVRQVMDRMLASEEQIQQAQQVRNMMPTFQTQEQSGMSDAEWGAYQDMLREAEEMAVTDLTRASVRQMKWLSNARSRVIKELQKEANAQRKVIATQVAEEVKQLPVYRAMEFLKRGRTVDQDGNEIEVLQGNKMSIDSVNALYPESATGLLAKPEISKLGYGKYGMLAKEGLPVEMVAEIFGFKSPDTMIRALLDAKPLSEEIDARTDQRMLEEHGDMNNPAAMEQAVEQALHNEARARFVAVELRYLAKSTAPVRVMTAAAKQVANQIISAKVIKEIKPRDYSVAEARASREAQAASKKGSTAEAARAKQNQLVQNQLAAEAVAARQEVQKAITEFRKLFKADDRLAKNRNMDLVNAARSIVAYYGLGKKGKPPTDYIDQLRAYNPDMYNDIAPLIQDAASGAKNYTDLTMDEFRMMRDTVEALWFQSKREKQIMIEGQAMDLEQAVSELNTRLEEIGVPGEVAGEAMAPSTKDRAVRQINVTKAILRRVEHWADATDGPKGIGPFTKYIWRPVRAALDQYRAERNIYVKRYVDLVKTVDLKGGKIESNELGYTFGNANGGIGKAELLGALLHTGNKSNLRKLLVGRGWGKINEDGTLDASRWYAFQQRMIDEGKLTKTDFDWAQSVWDLTEEMKPLAQKAHKDIFGYYFKEVASTPLATPFGVYRGGYVPAKTDPFLVRDAQKNAKIEELEGDFRNSMPSTGMGFTKGRVEYNQPLSLDIRVMTKHIDDVIRFAFVQPAIKDVLKIIRNRDFTNNLSRIDPSAVEEMLLPWLNRAARQITMEPGMHKAVDSFWQGVRNRTGIAIMFANITNALQQVTGYFPALLKVQARYMKTSLALYMRNPTKTSQEVAELSPFMDDRMNNRMFELQEIINEILLNPSKFNKVQQWSQRHGYFLQQALQNQVDTVVWMAKYNEVLATLDKSVNDVKAHKEAISQADAAVRMTQDSYAVEDVAAFQVGSPFYKTFTQFAGYFNMLANLNGSEYVKVFRDMGWRGNKGKLFSIYLLGFAAPMLVSEAIVKTLAGDWDDEDDDGYIDDLAEWFFVSQIRGAVAGIPAFGPGILAIGNAFNNKPYDDRMTTSPSVSMLEGATIGVAKAVINVVDPEREVTGKNVRDVLTLLSLVTGIPLVVLGRPVGYAIDVERSKIDPTSEADYVRGLITGKASEASR